jgi:hypothetical protein
MSFSQQLRKFRFDRPQRIAAVLLFLLFAQCYWVTRHQTLTEQDYQYARCGREMWERPSPLEGYFTSCSIHDETLAYRAAGLPLTIERIFSGLSVGVATPAQLCAAVDAAAVHFLRALPGCGALVGDAAVVWE